MSQKVSEIKQVATPLEPIEINKDSCPTCRRVLSVFSITLTAGAFGSAMGAALSMAEIGVTLTTAVGFGSIIGIVVGIFLGIFIIGKELTPEHEYCLLTLEQIKKARPDLKDSIEKASTIFSRNPVRLHQAYEYHDLANAMTDLTPHMKTRADLTKIWEKFVGVLHGMEVVDNMGDKLRLDFSLEKERMNGVKVAAKMEMLNPRSETFESDLKQIHALQQQCFGSIGTYSITDYFDKDGKLVRGSEARFSSPDPVTKQLDGAILIRREGSEQILGFLWYTYTEDGEVLICSVGRKADATKLNIGKLLFKQFLQMFAHTSYELTLNVRASNQAAIHLYEQHFFEMGEIEKDAYKGPVEDMCNMKFNRAAFLAAQTTPVEEAVG